MLQTFPPEEVCAYYNRTGKVPTTSGSTPYDFESIYDPLFAKNPDLQILHLAYSAVTTCSYHSCELAVEGKPIKKATMYYIDADPAEEIGLINPHCFDPKTLILEGDTVTLPAAAVAAIEIET